MWNGAGIPTPPFTPLPNAAAVESASDSLRYPVIVKPAHEGSSIGISKVETAEQLRPAWDLARRYDEEVFAEQWITGQEFTAANPAVSEALPLIRLETPQHVLRLRRKIRGQ